MVDSIGLSPRRFIELFEREVGLTPKLYCRVRRFRRAAHRIWALSSGAESTGAGDDFSAIAFDCGFADQSHLIREFREFSGLTPAEYARRRGHHAQHVPLV